jgi:hypothetical protein
LKEKTRKKRAFFLVELQVEESSFIISIFSSSWEYTMASDCLEGIVPASFIGI